MNDLLITKNELKNLHKNDKKTPVFGVKFLIIEIIKWLLVAGLLFALIYTILVSPALIVRIKYNINKDATKISYDNVFSPAFDVSGDNVKNNLLDINIENSYLQIPKLNINVPIIWNINSNDIISQLKNGVVHYNETATPDQAGNVFIVGHSSDYLWSKGNYKQIFALLDKLSNGDYIYIKYNDIIYSYRVSDLKVVSPSQVEVLNSANESKLSLMTCVPVGTSLNRLIVTAMPVSLDAKKLLDPLKLTYQNNTKTSDEPENNIQNSPNSSDSGNTKKQVSKIFYASNYSPVIVSSIEYREKIFPNPIIPKKILLSLPKTN